MSINTEVLDTVTSDDSFDTDGSIIEDYSKMIEERKVSHTPKKTKQLAKLNKSLADNATNNLLNTFNRR